MSASLVGQVRVAARLQSLLAELEPAGEPLLPVTLGDDVRFYGHLSEAGALELIRLLEARRPTVRRGARPVDRHLRLVGGEAS